MVRVRLKVLLRILTSGVCMHLYVEREQIAIADWDV